MRQKQANLITGGAGFLGANLAFRLLTHEENVIIVDNLSTSDGSNLPPLTSFHNCTFINWDITHPFTQDIANQLSSVTTIYHLACPTGVPNITLMSEEMLRTCSIGTLQILELAKKNSAKILFTSSSEVYGDPLISPQTENYTGNVDPIGPRSPYEEGKRVSESLMHMYVQKYDVHGVIVRIFNTYGPMMSRNDTRVVPHFFTCLKENKPLPVQGKGDQTRTFCYVDDLVNGLILVMEKGTPGDVYNIGSEEEISIYDMTVILQDVFGVTANIIYTERPMHDHSRRKPDLTKIQSLGWQETISLAEGLQRTKIWYG